jgi:hypothetical protein
MLSTNRMHQNTGESPSRKMTYSTRAQSTFR